MTPERPLLRLRRGTLVALIAVLLVACGGGIRPGEGDQRRWQLSGKIGLRATNMAESALIDWRHCGSTFDISLAGPLGQTGAHISGRGEQIVVQLRNREPVVTREPEALLQREFGWTIPLHALEYWVRGEAAPGASAEISSDPALPGRPVTLAQFGWQVSYRDWHHRDALWLPARLVVASAELRATLLIREWHLNDAVRGCPNL